MAFLLPILGGLAGYGTAAALGLSTAATAATTAGGALVGASLMGKGKKGSSTAATTDTTAVTDAATTDTITTPTPPADTGPPPPIEVAPTTRTGTGQGTTSRSGGQEDYAAALPTASGPADVKAIETMKKGRRSTILTSAQGLLSEQESGLGILRQRRTLGGRQGLIV